MFEASTVLHSNLFSNFVSPTAGKLGDRNIILMIVNEAKLLGMMGVFGTSYPTLTEARTAMIYRGSHEPKYASVSKLFDSPSSFLIHQTVPLIALTSIL